jgi:hypothetical protein
MSLAERSSRTKSGQMGAKEVCWSGVRAFQRSVWIQAASGERVAPLGRVNPVLESKTSPVFWRSAQLAAAVCGGLNCQVIGVQARRSLPVDSKSVGYLPVHCGGD